MLLLYSDKTNFNHHINVFGLLIEVCSWILTVKFQSDPIEGNLSKYRQTNDFIEGLREIKKSENIFKLASSKGTYKFVEC